MPSSAVVGAGTPVKNHFPGRQSLYPWTPALGRQKLLCAAPPARGTARGAHPGTTGVYAAPLVGVVPRREKERTPARKTVEGTALNRLPEDTPDEPAHCQPCESRAGRGFQEFPAP